MTTGNGFEGDARDIDLTAYDQEYEQAQPPAFDEVPDGKYQVRIETVRLTTSRNGDPMLKWDLVVMSGPHQGRHIFKNAVITTASLPFVKGDLKVLGLALPRFSDLPQHLDEVLDKTLQVTKRTRDDFTNVYFNKLLVIPDGAAAGSGLANEPVPF